jgi:plasmid stability protein
MATLHVRNFPDELYRQTRMIAASRGITPSRLIIELMQAAVERNADHERHAIAMAEIRRRFARRPRSSASGAELVRSARDERE